MLDHLNIVIKDMKRRKFSSFLTLLAISLGILTIYSILSVSSGFEQSVMGEFDQLGVNRIQISSELEQGFTQSTVNLIDSRNYIEETIIFDFGNRIFEYSNEFQAGSIFASELSQEFFEDFNVKLEKGRFPKEGEKFAIAIGPRVAEELFKKEISVGSNLYFKDTKFKVVGILESVGNPQDDSQIYMDFDTFKELEGEDNNPSSLFVTVIEGYDVNVAAQNLDILLENRLGEDTYEINTLEDLLEQFLSVLTIIQVVLGGIAVVALIVGAFGIINTMYVIVTEKTKDIGIMKSVGATNEMILSMYMFEAGLFGGLGAIAGVIQGIVVTKAFEIFVQSFGYTFLSIAIDPLTILLLILFGFIIGIVSGYLPARKASRLKIVEALRR